MNWSVIIPVCILNENLLDLFCRAVDSLKPDHNNYELIVVENGSDEIRLTEGGTRVHTEKPLGYAEAVNLGLKVSSGDRIMILNSDAEVQNHDWQHTLDRLFDSCYDIGLAIPLLKNKGEPRFSEQMVGACWCLKKRVYEEVGDLSTEYGLGYFEDTDYFMRVKKAGFQIKPCSEVKVKHEGRSTYEEVFDESELKENFEENFNKFSENYGSHFPTFD